MKQYRTRGMRKTSSPTVLEPHETLGQSPDGIIDWYGRYHRGQLLIFSDDNLEQYEYYRAEPLIRAKYDLKLKRSFRSIRYTYVRRRLRETSKSNGEITQNVRFMMMNNRRFSGSCYNFSPRMGLSTQADASRLRSRPRRSLYVRGNRTKTITTRQ